MSKEIKEFMIVVTFITAIAMGAGLCITYAKHNDEVVKVQSEAVERGYAKWTTKDGKPHFEWIEPK